MTKEEKVKAINKKSKYMVMTEMVILFLKAFKITYLNQSNEEIIHK